MRWLVNTVAIPFDILDRSAYGIHGIQCVCEREREKESEKERESIEYGHPRCMGLVRY